MDSSKINLFYGSGSCGKALGGTAPCHSVDLLRAAIEDKVFIMVTETEILMEIGRRRGANGRFARVGGDPATSEEFGNLGDESEVIDCLRRMGQRGLLTYSNADDAVGDVMLSNDGEGALNSMRGSLVVTGETL